MLVTYLLAVAKGSGSFTAAGENLDVWFAALADRVSTPVKYTLIGDSVTAGSGASNNIYAWANLLQDDLVAAYGAYFTQTNDGVGAQVTTFLGSGYISAIPAETALVTIELGINDAYYEVGASTFGSNLETLIDQIRAVTDASILVIGSYSSTH